MVCRYAFLFLLIPPDLLQSDKSAIHFVALCCAFNISRLTAFFNAETKSLALFTYCPEFFLQFAYQFLPAGFFSDFAVPAWLQGFSRLCSAVSLHGKRI